jgi:hypothetical protein
LLARPPEVLAELGCFIGHDLDYARILKVAIGSVSEPNTSFKEKPEETGFNPVGRWKEKLSPRELARLEVLVGGLLEELRYPRLTPVQESRDGFQLKGMRALYRLYFDSKQWLKTNTPLGRRVGGDLSWL